MKLHPLQNAPYAAQFQLLATQLTLFLLLFIGGMGVSRILYELFFPQLAWLGRPLTVLLFASIVALIGWGIWLKANLNQKPPLSWIVYLPLLLNTLYLMDTSVDLVRSRLIFAASIWLMGLLWARMRLEDAKWGWGGVGFIIAALLPLYLLTMSAQVGRDDVFEFQVVAPQLGIVHPTGYPLYLLLGKLFTLLPFGSTAWRLNFGSLVYALLALSLLYWLLWRLWKRPFPAIFATIALGLSATFWSQAIIAEVYTLHALLVTAVLTLLIIGYIQNQPALFLLKSRQHVSIAIFLLLGFGLTNHLTTLILIPVVFLTHLPFATRHSHTHNYPLSTINYSLKLLIAFLTPLLLYAYLPIRWQAVVGEPMGAGRFIDWVIGGRFQGALQLMAWLRDPTRYEIVGRLFLDNWGWFHLAIALIGLAYLAYQKWRVALLLFLVWLGFSFYCISYYVPDLAVFLIPAQLVVAIWWGTGLVAIGEFADRTLWNKKEKSAFISVHQRPTKKNIRVAGLYTLLFMSIILTAVSTYLQLDQSTADGRTQWGTAVLNLPLAQNSAILADSDKYPPLFYLQQTAGMRPDLDISVWPDEAAYRAQLDARLAAGQTVYLARFLPGLEGIYHLRSVGPLTEVSSRPLAILPDSATPSSLVFDSIRLLGYELETEAALDGTQTAVTFYWQSAESISVVRHVYVRWQNERATAGQHPANNDYPTVAWKEGEIVPDYHLWPRPILPISETRALQVALAPPFTPPNELEWQTVAEVELAASKPQQLKRPLRTQIGSTTLTAANFPAQLRPQQPFPITLSGSGSPQEITFILESENNSQFTIHNSQFIINSPFLFSTELIAPTENGRFHLIVSHPSGATCGWMRPVTTSCDLGEVEISGVPLPVGATNFEDKIALLDVNIADSILQPSGQLSLTLNWQSLTAVDEDYTVFVQLLDAQDRIVGQVDSWPVQGTYPTSQWAAGETISDPYLIQLDADLPASEYRLQIGYYLLATLRRLPVLNADGVPIDDKVIIPGLIVP